MKLELWEKFTPAKKSRTEQLEFMQHETGLLLVNCLIIFSILYLEKWYLLIIEKALFLFLIRPELHELNS